MLLDDEAVVISHFVEEDSQCRPPSKLQVVQLPYDFMVKLQHLKERRNRSLFT